MPLYVGGLWLAVTWSAPVSPRSTTVQATTGVGVSRSAISASTPFAHSTRHSSSAVARESARGSYPIATVGRSSSVSTRA